MKRIISGALILALSIGAAQAQKTNQSNAQRPAMEQRHPGGDMMALNNLNLSADQKTRLKGIREDFKKQMQDLNKQDQLSVADMRKRREELHQKYQSQVDAVLTPDQRAQLQKNRAEWKEKNKDAKGWMKGNKGQGHFGQGRMGQELNLTADQKQKMDALHQQFKPKMDAIRNDHSLTQEQKKAKMHELHQQQQEQMKSILTPDQVQKMQNLRRQKTSKNL